MNSYAQTVNVADDVISSGRSNYPPYTSVINGHSMVWYGLNYVNILYSQGVVAFMPYANTYLSGTSANNVIDDMWWG